jgi:hypothetical protein
MAILALAFNHPVIDGNLSNLPHFTPSNLKIMIHHVDKWLMEALNPPHRASPFQLEGRKKRRVGD